MEFDVFLGTKNMEVLSRGSHIPVQNMSDNDFHIPKREAK